MARALGHAVGALRFDVGERAKVEHALQAQTLELGQIGGAGMRQVSTAKELAKSDARASARRVPPEISKVGDEIERNRG